MGQVSRVCTYLFLSRESVSRNPPYEKRFFRRLSGGLPGSRESLPFEFEFPVNTARTPWSFCLVTMLLYLISSEFHPTPDGDSAREILEQVPRLTGDSHGDDTATWSWPSWRTLKLPSVLGLKSGIENLDPLISLILDKLVSVFFPPGHLPFF